MQETVPLLRTSELRAAILRLNSFDATATGTITPDNVMRALGLAALQVSPLPAQDCSRFGCAVADVLRRMAIAGHTIVNVLANLRVSPKYLKALSHHCPWVQGA